MSTDISPWDAAASSSEVDFLDLIEGASFIKGRDVVKKEVFTGIPFAITGMRFAPGKGGKDFVILEATTKDNRAVIINDGSSGIRRTAIAYLHNKGFIDVGPGEDSGDTSRFDRNPSEWKRGGDTPYFSLTGKDVLVSSRGLRASTYLYTDADGNEDTGVTYYMV